MMNKTYPLDTAAKLFPPVTRPTNTSVYRLSMVMTEAVKQDILQKAAEMTLARYPYIAVKLTKTVSDCFFEANDAPFTVRRECDMPCAPIDEEKDNGYLIRILWYENVITLEMFHALADGAGASEILKTLVYCYLTCDGVSIDAEGKILLPGERIDEAEYEDSFLKYYEGGAAKVSKLPPAFKIKGQQFEQAGHSIIQGILGIDGLKSAAKSHGATITEYLCALMIYSIRRENVDSEVDDEPIVLSVPVNLRGLFPSKTIRNFFCILSLSVSIEQADTFRSTLDVVSEQLREKTKKENLFAGIKESCGVMENGFVKSVPRFLREAGTRFVFAFFSEDVKTITMSNVGVIDLPRDMLKYIQRAETLVYPTERSPINCCMCSVNGIMTITFIKTIKETNLLRFFFNFLARETGAEVKICTNEWGVH
ncbi:MAG: alcohol acetyltransferase [Christensenella sp.]